MAPPTSPPTPECGSPPRSPTPSWTCSTAEIESVIVNGEEVEPEYDGSRIQLHGLHTHRENLVIVTAKLPYQHTGQGLHRFVDPADGKVYLYTHFEAADSRRMYSVFEQPDLKAHVGL